MSDFRADMRFVTEAWFDWDRVPTCSYFRDIPSVVESGSIPFPAQVTFFTGENGSGKSSVLEAVASACGFDRQGGTSFDYIMSDESATDLGDACHVHHSRRPLDRGYFFRAETFHGLVFSKGLDDEDGRSYLDMSHGEGFLSFMQSDSGEGLFLMDEPEAALSPQRQMSLLLHMHYMSESGSQFIVVTHSPVLLSLPGAAIMQFGDGGVEQVEYEDTEPYQITKMFIEDREQVFSKLFAE